jgi:hypothetical protein
MADPVFEKFTMQFDSQLCNSKEDDLFRLWGTYFSPVGSPQKHISIPISWEPFFTVKLLK